MRYPDWLHVVLTTHAVDAVTNLDVDLAGEITALAATFGAVSTPRAAQALEAGRAERLLDGALRTTPPPADGA